MGKRSDGQFERRPQDFYRTWDFAAIRPLAPFLPTGCDFVEPCAGDGVLVDHLVALGHRCVGAFDVNPRRADIRRQSAFRARWRSQRGYWITNPPWTREIMHPMIRHLVDQTPGWFLFDADWVHTVQAVPMLPLLRKIVAVGRVRWIEGTDMAGKDNVAWHLFDGTRPPTFIEFHGRQP